MLKKLDPTEGQKFKDFTSRHEPTQELDGRTGEPGCVILDILRRFLDQMLMHRVGGIGRVGIGVIASGEKEVASSHKSKNQSMKEALP